MCPSARCGSSDGLPAGAVSAIGGLPRFAGRTILMGGLYWWSACALYDPVSGGVLQAHGALVTPEPQSIYLRGSTSST